MAYPPGGPPGFGPYGTPAPGPPPGGYGSGYGPYGGYGYGPQQVEHPQGTTILVLGILSLVACQLCGPFAWSMGNRAKRAIDAEPGRYSNASNVAVGRILGIVASVLLIVQAVFGVLWLLLILGSIGASSTSGY